MAPRHPSNERALKDLVAALSDLRGEIHTNLGWFKETHAERAVMLLVIFIVALYLRIILPWASSIQGGSIIINDFDPYYHLRIIENTIQHFPYVLAYDPYVNYPTGFWIGWPPLFDFLAAAYTLVAMALFHVDWQVGVATFPALLGALAILPIYYITKLVFDWKAGIVAAALLTVIPANILRSMVGNVNHHVAAEVLFPALLFLFLMLALKGELTFGKVRRFAFTGGDRRTLLYAALAGVFVTAGLLTWLGSFLFLGIIGAFAIVQYSIYHVKRLSSDNLTIILLTMLFVSLITLLPVSLTSHFGLTIDTLNLSLFQPLFLVALIIIFAIFGFLAYYMRGMRRATYPLTICALVVAAGVGFYLWNPGLAVTVFGGYGFFTGSGVLQTVAEAQPLFGGAGGFQLGTAAEYFQLLLFVGLAGLAVLVYRMWRKQDEAALLLAVWSVFAFALAAEQTRFTFLLSANVAILSGFVIVWIMDALIGKSYGKLSGVRDVGAVPQLFGREVKYTQLLGVLIVVAVLLLPSISVTTSYARTASGVISPDWAESVQWMSANTPVTSNYNVTSDQIPQYGVLSWWDYGNWIIFLGHRPAIANNFQTGISDSATFFVSQNESDTLGIIQKDNVKYVMTDYEMAGYTDKFPAIALLSGQGVDTFLTTQAQYDQNGTLTQQTVPTDAYYNTTVVRLQYEDGNGYSHYRLIHESPTTVGTLGETDIKAVKTFEYVEGARIAVHGNGNATLSLNVTTNQNRTFNYTQSAQVNGTNVFVVPYSTTGMPYGIKTDPAYKVTVGNVTKEIAVSESDVQNGTELNLSF
ncbi:MAG: oligosaccharyl transferase, archaeosortase A system-associated [Halobacteriota archaeon]